MRCELFVLFEDFLAMAKLSKDSARIEDGSTICSWWTSLSNHRGRWSWWTISTDSGNVFNNSACAFVLSRALNWSPRLFMRFQFVQAAVTFRLTWKPSGAFLRDASHRARNNFWWQKDHSGVPTGLRGFTLKRATCAATSCFTHRRGSVRTSIPVPGVFPRRRFAPVKRIYILYIKGLKSPTRQTITLQTRHKSEKWGKDDTHEVRRGFTFLFDFPKNASWDIQTHRCTKVIKHCACAVKSTSLGR